MTTAEMSYVVLEALKEIFQMQKCKVEHEFAPYFYRYFASAFSSPGSVRRYAESCRHIFDVTQAQGKRVLDAGCGFGLISMFLAAFGAQKVTGVDHNQEKISVFHKILHRFDPPLTNIEARLGDSISLRYPDESFDVVIANEVISHVRDFDAFLSEIDRVLAKGGILYISDGNNSLNIFERYQRREFWRKREYGPVKEEDLRGTDKPLPWLLIRRGILQEKFPHLDSEMLGLLAKETAGLYGNQIMKAAEEYLERGQVLNRPAFKFRDPETGEYQEFEFNPLRLNRELQKAGFSAKVLRPYLYTGYPLRPNRGLFLNLVAWAGVRGIRAFHPLSLLVAPFFEIVARKKGVE